MRISINLSRYNLINRQKLIQCIFTVIYNSLIIVILTIVNKCIIKANYVINLTSDNL